MKIKPRSHVQVVQDGNDELIVGDDVFPLDELVDSYRVASFNDLKENSNFHIAENTFVDVDIDVDVDVYVDVDVEELNDVLRTNGHTQVNEDNESNEINVEDCDGYDDDKIKEEDDSY